MLTWRKEFELGIKAIDDQHKELVHLGGKLMTLLTDEHVSDYFDEIYQTLQELESYTITHFEYEEKAFDKVDFVGSAAHKFEHKLFIKKLESYMSNLERVDENQKETLLELLNFISDWLVKHIDKTDREYVSVLTA